MNNSTKISQTAVIEETKEAKESSSKTDETSDASTRNELDFDCEYTENLPAILNKLNISLAFTSYQAGRLMLVRSDGEALDINFKSFPRPMGLAATEDGLTLGIFTQVINFQREDGLLETIKKPLEKIEKDITAPRIKPKESPKEASKDMAVSAQQEEEINPVNQDNIESKDSSDNEEKEIYEKQYLPVDERVDACFITRSAHYSGMINIHDVDWGDEGLWAVNSSFSCLCTLEPDYSFVPQWKPYFISDLVPEDRCHLNGMTLKDGKPAYVTTFSKYNEVGKWRSGDKFDGTLMDVEKNKILIDGLAMPHSPRWYKDRVYFCNSGYGKICDYHPVTEQLQTIAEVPGFTRGMDFYGPLMFVGLSKVREADVTRPAPLSKKYDQTYSGIWLFDLDDRDDDGQLKEVGHIKFTGNVDQIYDVAVIPDCSFPELIEPNHPRMRNHFCHPEIA